MTQRTGTAGRIRRLATGATAVLAATTLLAGCSGTDGEGTPEASPSVTPKAALLAAVPDEKDPTFLFSGSDATGNVTGVVDPAGKGMELNLAQKDAQAGFTMKLSFRVIEQRSWMKVSFDGAEELSALLKLPKRWMELDQTKIKDPEGVPSYEGADPGNTGVIIRTAGTVEDQGNGTYAGTVDLTSGPEVADAVEGVDVAALGDAAKAVPFTAVVGPDGNLTSLTLDIPAAGKQKAVKYVVKYSDFGTAPQVTAPSGDQVEAAPASAYELLNS